MPQPSPITPATRGRLLRSSALLALSIVSTGCATKGDLRNVETRIDQLSGRQEAVLQELQRQSRITVDTLRTQSDQLVDLRGNINQSLRQILAELETLRELTGQNQRTIASMRDQLLTLQQRMRSGAPPAGEGLAGQEGVSEESPEAMYSAAMDAFQRGSLVSAEIGFRRFLQTFPESELAPLAHFNLGDVYYQDERFEQAVQEFEKIPERFPANNRVPDALYRIGVIYLQELERPEDGRRFLERVVNSYPDSGAAGLAQRALDESGG
ncbi:MAG: tol-pal system protein YbgF [Gemmatimonadota bacterium]|jgi:tol-pal system protein YbgF